MNEIIQIIFKNVFLYLFYNFFLITMIILHFYKSKSLKHLIFQKLTHKFCLFINFKLKVLTLKVDIPKIKLII